MVDFLRYESPSIDTAALSDDALLDQCRRVKDERDRRQRERRRAAADAWRAGLGVRYAEATLDSLQLSRDPRYHRAQQDVLARLHAFAEDLAGHRKRGTNLWLIGTAGTGKTHAAIAIGHTAASLGMIVRFARREDLFASARRASLDGGDSRFLDGFHSADLAILDDLTPAIGQLTPFQSNTLFGIADNRNARRLPTIVTSNVGDRAELDETLTAQTADRLLADPLVWCEFRWPSWRTESRAAE